jgi:hypothetical protein
MSEEKKENKSEKIKEDDEKNQDVEINEVSNKKSESYLKGDAAVDGNKNYIFIGILIILLGLTMFYIMKNNKTESDYQAVAESVHQEISDNLQVIFDEKLAPGQGTEIKSIQENKYLYKVEITVAGNDFTVYLTKDQKTLIPQVIEMSELMGDIEKTSADASGLSEENKAVLGIAAGAKPQVDYFVMSFCPYGNPADENASKIAQLFGDSVNVVPHYILSMDPKAPNGYNSMHGPQEAHQDIRELCVLNEYGQDAYFKFTLESNKTLTPKNADTDWEQVATNLGLDVNKITTCVQKDGLAMAKTQIDVTNNAKSKGRNGIAPIAASPTVLVNGETVPSSAAVIQKALCDSFSEGEKPAACDMNVEDAVAGDGSCN